VPERIFDDLPEAAAAYIISELDASSQRSARDGGPE
jgi:hypothetical protein